MVPVLHNIVHITFYAFIVKSGAYPRLNDAYKRHITKTNGSDDKDTTFIASSVVHKSYLRKGVGHGVLCHGVASLVGPHSCGYTCSYIWSLSATYMYIHVLR